MIYVFDSSALIRMFTYYPPSVFPSVWEKFDEKIKQNQIFSAKEALKEIQASDDRLAEWAKNNSEKIFLLPNSEEMKFVAEIFKVPHFEYLIGKKTIQIGGPCADPFLIAKAKILNGYVVTQDGFYTNGLIKENSSQLAPVCKHFGVNCVNLQQFMENEGWSW
jgi:predicted nucleic acid-binding protein